MGKLNTVYLSLGSDLGDRKKNISDAIELIKKKAGKVQKQSSFYESKPLGFKSDTLFYNICIEIETTLTPIGLLKLLQKIELKLGRIKDPSAKMYASRIIDIDILYYNQVIFMKEILMIPHPHIRERKFVLYLQIQKTIKQLRLYLISVPTNRSLIELISYSFTLNKTLLISKTNNTKYRQHNKQMFLVQKKCQILD